MNALGFKKGLIVDNTSVTEKVEDKKITRNRPTRGGTLEAIALGERLQKIQKTKGLPSGVICEALGITNTSWNNYKRGVGVMPAVFVKPLCQVFGVSASELFDYTVPEDAKEEAVTSTDDKIAALEKIVMSLVDEVRKRNEVKE